MNNKHILKWALIIGIIIVLNLFFHFATSLVYKAPKFENFCQNKQVNIQPSTQETCLKMGGAWNEGPMGKPVPAAIDVEGRTVPASANSYCDTQFTCQKDFETANNLYRRNVFVVMVVLGLLSLLLGFALATNEVISLGLSYGGILSFIIASIQYWSAMDDYLRVIILGLALAVLIYLGYKKFKD
ncbi:MAG: hypothetical protein WC531_01670 [Candidatus Paceibacterota bacterium]|jgi:hypothetical protein